MMCVSASCKMSSHKRERNGMAIQINPRRCLAVWYQCPECKATYGRAHMTPSKKNRDYVPVCLYCDVPEVITRRRYYRTWASDLYGVAGTCEELCAYYYLNIRAFKRMIAERTAEREREAKAYYERQRIIEAEAEKRRLRQREEAALFREAERVAYQATHAVELEAEGVARAVWPPEEKTEWMRGDPGDFDDDHPF